MADYNSDEDTSPNITITLKSTSENHTIEAKENSTIRKVCFFNFFDILIFHLSGQGTVEPENQSTYRENLPYFFWQNFKRS